MRSSIATVLAVVVLSSCSLAFGQAKLTRPEVSETACPLEVISISTPDNHETTAVVRRPPGKGPFPAVVYFHGGSATFSADQLQSELRGQTLSRFLAAGYVTVAGTGRPVRQISENIADGLAVVAHVKTLPEVDPKSVVVWGDSGGGSLALDIAAATSVAAITVQEPASILFTRTGVGANRRVSMTDPKSVYTTGAQKFTRAKIEKISCPIFLAHGDIHAINKVNHEVLIPELKACGKDLQVKLYPGENHGFSRRSVATLDGPKRFFDDSDAFFKRHLSTKPTPIPQALSKEIVVELEKGRSLDRQEP